MKKNKKTGGAFVCPDALIRKQLRAWAPDQRYGSEGHTGPLCIRIRQAFSLLEQTSGTKREA